MAGTEPYRDTSVSVERSKTQIRDALKRAGARAMQIEETWDGGNEEDTNDGTSRCVVRFLWPTDSGAMLRIRLEATPLPPERGSRGGWRVDSRQRERQAWRSLAWYLESLVKASTFGLIRFEEIFLAHIEDPETGRTIGEVLIPELEHGRLALPAAK